jgi:hypothetical protein
MNKLLYSRFGFSICAFSLLALFVLFFSSAPVLAGQSILKKYIIEFNLKAIEKNLSDGSYRGEEGILAMRPEEARSFGLKVAIDDDYIESMRLFEEAEEYLAKAKQAMSSGIKERTSGYYAKEISDNFLRYKNSSIEAKKRLATYRSRLKQENDDRLNELLCAGIIDRVLEESLKNSEKGLRDKLALFYNTCHGINSKNYPITETNVRFVNHVFNGFLKDASDEEKKKYDLDLDQGYINQGSFNWKDAAGFGISEYVALLDASIKKLGNTIYPVDPLLFMALMRRESGFDPSAVSSVGAAGLTQIMPETARDLGMSNIFMPEYYFEAGALMKKEREARNSAMSTLHEINDENGLKVAEKARKLMQDSLELGRKRAELFEMYEKDLLKNRSDERLKAATAIEYGLRYFAGLMKRQNGDISLALSSYNAGEYRVRDFNGIPPYRETVGFRNKVLEYYHEYLDKVISK